MLLEEKEEMEQQILAVPPKAQSMYEAVIELVANGQDINNMKVSEITKEAGIGKGTAYEYFKTKEELITGALTYDVLKKSIALCNTINEADGFEGTLYAIFSWLKDNFKQSRTFTILVKIAVGSYDVSSKFRTEFFKNHCMCNMPEQILDHILEQGEQEGRIQKMSRYYGRTAIIAQVMAFAVTMTEQEEKLGVTQEEAMNFAIRSIIKMLND